MLVFLVCFLQAYHQDSKGVQYNDVQRLLASAQFCFTHIAKIQL